MTLRETALWAAAVLCFFSLFRAGEISIPTVSGFDHSKHLAWGDIAINDMNNPQSLRVHLKWSKTDQLGKGIDAYIGKTDNLLCPVTAIMAYMAMHGPTPRAFFELTNGHPLTKSAFTNKIRAGL